MTGIVSSCNKRTYFIVTLALLVLCCALSAAALPNNPIVFVTSPPARNTFSGLLAMIGNHRGNPGDATRGGDLWIRYPDGSLKNLTLAAGYGIPNSSDSNMIAVRDPSPSWDGSKVIFSMVVGVPNSSNGYVTYWQMYEVSGLGPTDTPTITRVPNQPSTFNNVMPVYDSSNRIIFVSDRPPHGNTALYPRFDEYEDPAGHANTGIWRLNPANGVLVQLDNSPSGDFDPSIDSSGRIIFSRWDHLQRDFRKFESAYSIFRYSDESVSAQVINDETEVFPEPAVSTDPDLPPNVNYHRFNVFMPWQMNQDGTELETLNHIGRHEIGDEFNSSFSNDSNLYYFYTPGQIPGSNPNRVLNVSHISEDPSTPGLFFAVNANEFDVHSAGQIFTIQGPPNLSPDQMQVRYITHWETANPTSTPSVNHSGLYRDPVKLSDGTLIAAHTFNTQEEATSGSSRFIFRLRTLVQSGQYWVSATELTPGITKNITSSTGTFPAYSGTLREHHPVELRARIIPQPPSTVLPAPEQSIFNAASVDVSEFQRFLFQNNLALLVSRNVTSRDDGDRQQPFNLRVPGGVQSIGAGGTIYDVSDLQFVQGDFVGGVSSSGGTIYTGRRVHPQFMHESLPEQINQRSLGAPPGSVEVAADGSTAALVPARRPLSWQLTAPSGSAVVRERYWLTFQPGEVRVCASCHGVNTLDQVGRTPPTNPPQALLNLLNSWKDWQSNGGGGTPTPTPTSSPTPTPPPGEDATPTPPPSDQDEVESALSLIDQLREQLKFARKNLELLGSDQQIKRRKIIRARKKMVGLSRDLVELINIEELGSAIYPNLTAVNAVNLNNQIRFARRESTSKNWRRVKRAIELLVS